MDFRHAYHEHMRDTSAQLQRARRDGRRVRLPSGEVDTSRLSDRQLESLALKDAEFVVNMAIHQHNQELERNARK